VVEHFWSVREFEHGLKPSLMTDRSSTIATLFFMLALDA